MVITVQAKFDLPKSEKAAGLETVMHDFELEKYLDRTKVNVPEEPDMVWIYFVVLYLLVALVFAIAAHKEEGYSIGVSALVGFVWPVVVVFGFFSD